MNFKNVIFSLLVLFDCVGLNGQTFTHINYQEDNSNFPNPGRGFFHFVPKIDYNELLSYRKEGISIVFRSYHLNSFKNGPISVSFLRNMEQDFATLRKAGDKVVVRFSYTDKATPPYGDARPEIVLMHIRQLKPVLMANSDVILVLQAGFIGAWGEWFYTDYYSVAPGVISSQDWVKRRQLVDSLLAAIPPNRMVQVRTPEYKFKLLKMKTYTPVTPEEAYTDLPIARIAHHNDAFLSNPSNMGTYQDSAVEKPYLAQDTKFTIMGGETDLKSAQSICSNAVKEMRRFHWTFLNRDYIQSVLEEWKNQGCFPEIQRKLGYRFRLLSANIQNQSKPGGELNLNLKLLNDGWANPTNPRNVEIILKNKNSGKEYYLNPKRDMRFWPIADTIHINIKAGLPKNIENGDYDFFLNLSDGDTKLNDRPKYSIRLANTGVWDSISGYNSLNHSLDVDSANHQISTYFGANYFKEKNSIPPAHTQIIINGNADDWSTIPIIYSAKDQRANLLKIFNTKDTLFLLVQGNGLYPHNQFLFDTDNDSTTGAFYGPWIHTGFDYLIENNQLYQYSGTAHEWDWKYVTDVISSQNKNIIELKIPFDQMNKPSISNSFRMGFINNFDGSSDKSYLPLATENLITIKKNKMSQRPAGLSAKNHGTHNLVFWTRNTQSPDIYTILQRAEKGKGFTDIGVFNNNEIAYDDKDLQENHNYQYRIQYKEGNDLSAYSDTVLQTTTLNKKGFVDIKLDGHSSDWNLIPPSATGMVNGSIAAIRFYNNKDSLYLSIQAVKENTYQLYFNLGSVSGFDHLISNDSLFVYSLGNWVFQKVVSSHHSTGFFESGLKMSQLGLDTVNVFNAALLINGHDVWGNHERFHFMKYQMPAKPQYFRIQTLTDYTYSRIKIEWYPNQIPDGYVIERSLGDSLHFKQLVDLGSSSFEYIDRNLDSADMYYYRIFAYKGILRSAYTAARGMQPGRPLGINSIKNRTASVNIIPNPVKQSAEIQILLESPDKVEVNLFSINGQKIADLFRGEIMHEKILRFQRNGLPAGYYFLKIIGQKTSVYKKLFIY